MRIEGPSPTNTTLGVGLQSASPAHVATKPVPYGTNGHFRISRRLAPASTTLTGTLWTFRNPSASVLAIPLQVRLRLIQVANPTAAIEDKFSLTIARGYTVADTTGSASIAPATAKQKLRTSMGDSVMEVRESNIAAGASGGTKTLDTYAIATGSVWFIAAVPTTLIQNSLDIFTYQPWGESGEHPLVLAQNEGFYITNDNNLGAASGIVLLLDLAWVETTAF